MNEDANGVELIEGDKVILVGTITNIEQAGGHSLITIAADQQGDPVGLDFYSDELIKAKIERTISGALGGNT